MSNYPKRTNSLCRYCKKPMMNYGYVVHCDTDDCPSNPDNRPVGAP